MEYLCFVRKVYQLVGVELQFTGNKYTAPYSDDIQCHYHCKLITPGVQNKVSISEKEVR